MSFAGYRYNVTCPSCTGTGTYYHMNEAFGSTDKKLATCGECATDFVVKTTISIETETYILTNVDNKNLDPFEKKV